MYIAYSALAPNERLKQNLTPQHQIKQPKSLEEDTLQIRYRAHIAVCEKYSREITAIQKHIPGWQPKFYSK